MVVSTIDPRSASCAFLLLLAACADAGPEGTMMADASTGEGAESSSADTRDSDEPTTESSEGSSGDDPCSAPDADGDGHEATVCGGDDCDDEDALVHPGVEWDGWMQLVHQPFMGGGWQYHSEIVGSDGLVDIFWAFTGNLWRISQESEGVWGGPLMVGMGSEPHVALAPDGTHRMVYVGFGADQQSRGAFYTQVDSNEIHTLEELPFESPNPFGLDIEIDPASGTMHVVYGVLYEFPPTLRYATSDDGQAWTVETIATEAAGFGGTIVLDDGGVPHVSFASNENEVMHAARIDGSWSVEVVASGYEVAATSMAGDPDGDLHIAFSVTGLEDAEDGLHYVRSEDGQWGDATEVDADVVWYDEIGLWDYRPAIAIGRGGVPQIAYHDFGAGVLRYAALVDGGWAHRVVDDAQGPYYPQAGWYPQLQLTAGELHISETSDATNEYRRFTFIPDDGVDNDCDGTIDEGP